MATYKSTLDTTGLDALLKRAMRLDGVTIEWGIPAPAPRHTGRAGSSGGGVSTAFTLARVEFGVPRRPPKPRAPKRRGGLGRRVRATLGKLLGGFRGRSTGARRTSTTKPTTRERPVLRWVAMARRREMVKLFKVASLRVFEGRDPGPTIDALGQQLAAASRDRLQAVGGVVTGQTKRAITYKVTGD